MGLPAKLGNVDRPARPRHRARNRPVRRLAGQLAEGLRAAAGVAAIRWPLLAVAAHRLLLGAGFVVLVLIADSRYRLQISGYGVALAATGLAAFAGTLAAPPLARRYSPGVLVPAAFLPAAGAAYIAFQVLKIAVDALIGGNTLTWCAVACSPSTT